ncbi:stage V sporulation protein G [Ruminococcaceae bacterium KH2T8]|nr:stage V sporulation protein G [Ruminococcaceae bacterium KH2T8]
MNNTNTLPEVKAKITWKNDDPTAAKKAAASITIGNVFQIHGISIVEGQKGLFISMPQRASEKNGEKKYFEVAHPTTAEMRQAVTDAVMKAYGQESNMAQEAEVSESVVAPIMGQNM